MKFRVAFAVSGDNCWGKFSRYNLKDICILADRYSLRERELEFIVTMKPSQLFKNEDMKIERLP